MARPITPSAAKAAAIWGPILSSGVEKCAAVAVLHEFHRAQHAFAAHIAHMGVIAKRLAIAVFR